ncbi:hypothetical protein HII31_06552 [Pseudocercospora fuligena]|uniref:F-box domain-containing protein n=1 Tax=Pseudocercospora fuligena TaxID=685502 RepID=A0A8H6RGP7_9PEZI|nr:hypothetical protein HII31_06552 [Pseudocercospora fuligena]
MSTPAALRLPVELWDNIFSQFENERDVIGAARLTCKEFFHLSSPYLITRAVLADRLPALIKLEQLARHEYFSKTVTEFFYDASAYDFHHPPCKAEIIAGQKLPRSERFVNGDCDVCGVPDSRLIPMLCSEAQWAQMEALPTLGDDRDAISKLQRRECGVLEKYVDVPTEQNDYLVGPLQSRMDECGLRWRVTGEQLFLDMSDAVTKFVISKLPNLKVLTIGDFRSFAFEKEDYTTLCHRLFGHSLEPSLAAGYTQCLEVRLFSSIIAGLESRSGPALQSLSVGRHPYEMASVDMVDELKIPYWNRPSCVPLDGFFGLHQQLLKGLSESSCVFSALSSIQLGVGTDGAEYGPEDTEDGSIHRSGLVRLLEAASPVLERLSLHYQLPDQDAWSQARDDFRIILAKRKFPKLRELELRGWYIDPCYARRLLSHSTSSLRVLKMENVSILEYRSLSELGDSASERADQQNLTTWIHEHLSLETLVIQDEWPRPTPGRRQIKRLMGYEEDEDEDMVGFGVADSLSEDDLDLDDFNLPSDFEDDGSTLSEYHTFDDRERHA